MSHYQIIHFEQIEENVTFIRIEPTDITITLQEIFLSIANLSWIHEFDKEYLQRSFKVRADKSIATIKEKIIDNIDDGVTEDSGELIVSELARQSLIDRLNYSNIPMGDLIKEKKGNNHGFDFFSENNQSKIILFGEAKYLTNVNAYGKAFEQIIRFENDKKDVSDLKDLDGHCSSESLNKVPHGTKGFVAAFSSTSIPTDRLIENFKNNQYFEPLSNFEELICVAINL